LRWRQHLALLALLFVPALGWADNQNALNPVGPQSAHISGLFWLIFWVTLTVFVMVVAGFIWATFRGMGNAEPVSLEPEPQKPLRNFVATAAAATTVILFVFLVASFVTGKRIEGINAQSALQIDVAGHQWWWEVEYEDPIASNIVRTANEIHVPVGKPVQIIADSRDVIHSFWAPNVHGKRDLIPGQRTFFWIQVDKPGVYRGQCAEFCGHQHANMAFQIVAQEPAEFAAWLQAQRQDAAASNPETEHGQQVFLSSPCITCHTIRGTNAAATNGPDLTHIGSRRTLAAGTLPNTPGSLASWIVNAQGVKPGTNMPQMTLAPDDLNALVKYLESLK
jgi:cytochrome c oxidase subunit 2